MSKRIYEETAVIRQLNTRSDVFVIPATKTIELMVNHACGIKTWGKLDFLTRIKKYVIVKKAKLETTKKNIKIPKNLVEKRTNSKINLNSYVNVNMKKLKWLCLN